jgi:capsular polysaccharide biosynthesis protein
MTEEYYGQTIAKNWKVILLFGLASAIVGVTISLFFPLRYSSSMRLLIIQKQLSQADPYTAIKASESLADNLGQIIYTTSFFDMVMNANFNIDKTVFNVDEIQKRRLWREMIETQVIRGTGMLAVTVYHEDVEQATQIARAVAYVLTTQGSQYVGGGDLQVKLVDEPLQSRFPVRPNLPANALMGFVLGIIAGSGYVILESRKRGLFSIPD